MGFLFGLVTCELILCIYSLIVGSRASSLSGPLAALVPLTPFAAVAGLILGALLHFTIPGETLNSRGAKHALIAEVIVLALGVTLCFFITASKH